MNTEDDENEKEEYQSWKIRELKRIKRDREWQRERKVQVRHMAKEERRAWERSNPRKITNQKTKGKYKFLQRYYHRGAFYQDCWRQNATK